MKRFLPYFLLPTAFFAFCSSTTHADLPALRAQESVRVRQGRVTDTAVLADDEGQIFIEVPQHIVVKAQGQQHFNFDGYLLAPRTVVAPEKFPLAQSRELLTFQFATDTSMQVGFTDRYYKVPAKERLRYLERLPKAVRLYMPLGTEPEVRMPELWYYDERFTPEAYDDQWVRIGGVKESTSDPEVDLFMAVLNKSGIYSLFDRRPLPYAPVEGVDPSVIELAEESPFPSVYQEEGEVGSTEQAVGGSELEVGIEATVEAESVETTPLGGGVSGTEEIEEELIPAVEPLPERERTIDNRQQTIDNNELSAEPTVEAESVETTQRGVSGTEDNTQNNQNTPSTTPPLDLSANSFSDPLPRTGTSSSPSTNTYLLLSALILALTIYFYHKEKKAILRERR